MDCDRARPDPGSPESHWGTRDPAAQPDQTPVLGLKRMVIEARDRLGTGATPEAIAAELKARGITAGTDEVRRLCAEPY
jgi:hypothetical protein